MRAAAGGAVGAAPRTSFPSAPTRVHLMTAVQYLRCTERCCCSRHPAVGLRAMTVHREAVSELRNELRMSSGIIGHTAPHRFFGGFGFGMGGEEEETTPKGNDVFVELEVSMRDLYLGQQFEVPSPVTSCECAPSLQRDSAHPGEWGATCMTHCPREDCFFSNASHPSLQPSMRPLSASSGHRSPLLVLRVGAHRIGNSRRK